LLSLLDCFGIVGVVSQLELGKHCALGTGGMAQAISKRRIGSAAHGIRLLLLNRVEYQTKKYMATPELLKEVGSEKL
jgi:hypothetical protein